MNALRNPNRALVENQDASLVQASRVPRSTFINEYGHKTTFDQGKIIPFKWEEVFPGDHITWDISAYIRMATPLFPVFDNLVFDIHAFYVQYRILWKNWVKLQGQQDNPGDSIAYTVPNFDSPAGGFAVGSIFDQMGVPCVGQITAGQVINVSALPFRAYNRIYNEWYRDQDLVNSVPSTVEDSGDVAANYVLLNRAKMHDYFTTMRPWPQKFAAQSVPLTGLAPVTGIGSTSTSYNAGSPSVNETVGTPASYGFYQYTSAASQVIIKGNQAAGGRPQIFADLSQTSASFTVNTLRQAILLQEMYEQYARSGSRYTETLFGIWGVQSSDGRLQRPEYIGGGRVPIVITPIAQTATGGGGLGSIGGAGTAAGSAHCSVAAEEHGLVMFICSVRSELSYQQGLHPKWTRRTLTDFPVPALAELGEQAVLLQELYCTGTDASDTTIVGYQERYHEVRTEWSTVAGLFRSTSAGTIDQWHLAQRFTAAPTLGQTFIEDSAPMTRILSAGASANGMQFLADFHFKRRATRAFPKYGTPASLTRF